MATESDLRDFLRDPDPEGRGAIDVDAVLSRSRRRRRRRVIAAQALGSVALVGVLGTAIVVTVPPAPSGVVMTAEDADGGEGAATAPETDQSTLARIEPACGEPVTDPASSAGLTLEMHPITATSGTESLEVTIVLRNDGPTRVVGVSAGSPRLTLSLDGVVVWHSPAAQEAIGIVVDLEPGESMAYEATFEPVVCGSGDDQLIDDPEARLPAAGPGAYELRASLAITPDDGGAAGEHYLATGPAVAVEIR